VTNPPHTTPPDSDGAGHVTAARMQAVVEATLRDLHPAAPGLPPVALDSMLDRDLGLDSLARMELLLRVEREFGVTLPEETLQRAETVADLLQAAQRAAAPGARPARAASPALPVGAAPAPRLAATGGSSADEPSADATLLDVLDRHLQARPDQIQVICLLDEVEHPISYRQLAEASVHGFGDPGEGVDLRGEVGLDVVGGPDRAGGFPVGA